MESVGRVIENKKITLDFYHLKIKVPATFKIAKPGQFIHARVTSTMMDPLMRRPLSLYRVHPLGAKDWTAEALYRAVGHGTELLATLKPGDALNVLGPQGNPYSLNSKDKTLLMVAGGYGVAPLYFLCEKLLADPKNKSKEIHVILGARNKEFLLCVEEFKALGVHVHITTDDGSRGERGVVTGTLRRLLASSRLKRKNTTVYSCGPHRMLEAVAEVCLERKVSCQVSMEERMGCSVGVCLGCVCKVKASKKEKGMPPYRFVRVCTEGPVFDARQVIFR